MIIMKKTFDLNIVSCNPLIAPQSLKEKFPLEQESYDTIVESRNVINSIISKKDKRFLGIVGPCSIHDKKAAIEYAGLLNELRRKVGDHIYLVMRVYLDKPRTSLGWRGLITDPHLDGSYDIAAGLVLAREILLEITSMGLPAGTEMLDPIVPQYIDDLISWASIGARTTESQTHREMASGLSMPVGFKNGMDGSYEPAVNALKSCVNPHSFIGIDQFGKTSILQTSGNAAAHIISRGGDKSPNYTASDLNRAKKFLLDAGVDPAILIDCSHGNSGKDHRLQESVLHAVLHQRNQPDESIIGFMVESNLFGGNQKIPADGSMPEYGLSITDECVDWVSTEAMILSAYEDLRRQNV